MTTTTEHLVSKAYLKSHMLAVFRELEQEGRELIVTDYGRPVLRIIPIRPKKKVEEVFSDVRRKKLVTEKVAISPLPDIEYALKNDTF